LQYLNDALAAETLEAFTPYFNQEGRGFPDISAHSLLPNFQIVTGGRLGASGGTSAASPVWAALVGLLNDARLKAGLPSLGFINPWLYDFGEKFLVDITKGAARGCDGVNHQNGKPVSGAAVIPNAFWNATVGWDPATGLGIPDFQKMLASALAEDDLDD
jgi:tripeptidyl-peptidase-1